jgi:glutamate/tyrosine decarboxylase-like PLP-dependent enzyme
MRETRRDFFANAALLSAGLALPREILTAQNPPTPPPKPQPGYTPNPAEVHSNPAAAAAARRARLLENEKEFREGVERLYQLASGLRDELQKTPTTEVFSLLIVRKTEEIEKLAKRLKSQAKSA